jgi:Protein of unknown function (DUF3304)
VRPGQSFTAVLSVAASLLAACQPVSIAAPNSPEAGASKPAATTAPPSVSTATAAAFANVPIELEADGSRKRYSVVAYGYNYTDTYIDSFEVDGAGGGNLVVSTATSPGGGHTCCARVSSGTPPTRPFVILWTRDRKRWCELTAYLTQPVPIEPRYLEVHFYPDGHVELAATQEASPPRLKLDRFSRGERNETGNVDNDEKFARCRNGRR